MNDEVQQGVRSDAAGLHEWWQDLVSAALVGTARRPVPADPGWPIRGRAGAPPEVAMLDAAALGGAVRRAGRGAVTVDASPAAADDRLPAAPARAEQLLRLLLHQSPVGARLMPALADTWLRAARRAGVRVPHSLLCEVLELATKQAQLRSAARTVVDTRGAWLAAANPDWSWVLDGGPAEVVADPDEWALLPTEQRAAAVATLRTTDPAAGRALVESTWASDPAGDRSALLGALRIGLGPDDEELLERALDDRAGSVRETAYSLLDGLPGSARAGRLGELLRPLLSTKGLVRKSLDITLPAEPEAAAMRDGLGKARRGRSERGHWLQQLAAGAPLKVWTETTNADPRTTWRMVTDADARAGIRRAVLARRDPAWARALLADTTDPGLLALLPETDREQVALEQLARITALSQLLGLVPAVPAPWGPRFSKALVERLVRDQDTEYVVGTLLPALAAGLHPDALPAVRSWAERTSDSVRDPAHQLAQFLSITPSITEAFR